VRTGETTFGRGYGKDLRNGVSRPPTDAANGRADAARSGWEPAGPHTHGTHAGQQSREPTVPPLWGGAAGDATIARGSPPGGLWPTPAGRPAADNGAGRNGSAQPAAWFAPDAVPGDADDPTRARGPRRLEPWSPAPGATGHQTRAGNPAQPNSWDWMPDGGSGGRARQFPPEAPEFATLARPRAVVPGGGADIGPLGPADAPQGRGKSRRTLALTGGGVLVAAVVAVAVFGLGHGGGSPASAPTVGSQSDGPPVIPVGPGPLTVTARSIGGQQVEFSWVYANSAASDSFRVQVNGGSWKPVVPREPHLVLSVAQGQECIRVQVISADGVESPESSVSCSPKQ
jgi:hypothetical protein